MMGIFIGSGLHTLFIAIVGLFPQPSDDLNLWSTHFVYVSTVPIFITVIIGLFLAALRSGLAPLGIGLVAGAFASPLLWLAGGSAYHSG